MPGEKQIENARKAEFNRANYDRFLLTVPKGYQAQIKTRAAELGKSINQYVNDLIRADMDDAGHAARNNGRTADTPPAED